MNKMNVQINLMLNQIGINESGELEKHLWDLLFSKS